MYEALVTQVLNPSCSGCSLKINTKKVINFHHWKWVRHILIKFSEKLRFLTSYQVNAVAGVCEEDKTQISQLLSFSSFNNYDFSMGK